MTQLPNLITIARALAGVLGAWLLLESFNATMEAVAVRYAAASGVIFLLAAVSDWLDGWLARRLGVESPLGALLDPIGDKVLVGAYLIAYLAIFGWAWFLAAPVALILARDVAVTALRLARGPGDTGLKVSFDAKMKTAIQMAVVAAPFLLYPVLIALGVGQEGLDIASLIWVGAVWFLAVLTVWTALPYLRSALR